MTRVRPLNRAALTLACVALLAGGLTACRSASSGRAPAPRAADQLLAISDSEMREVGFRRDWTGFPFVARRASAERFSVTSAGPVVQDSDGNITRLDERTGLNRWTTSVATPLTRFVGVDEDTFGGQSAVMISTQSEVYWLDLATGNLLDRQNLAVVANTKPIIVGPYAVFASPTGEAFAHHRAATKAWGFRLNGVVTVDPVLTPAGSAAVLSQSGDLVYLEPISGALAGRAKLFDGAAFPPAVGDSAIFIASLDQSVYAFDFEGRQLWRYRTPVRVNTKPVAFGGLVYVEIPGYGMHAFDQGTGRIQWQNTDIRGSVVGESNGRLLVFDGAMLHTVAPESGTLFASAAIEQADQVVSEPFVDGDLYILRKDGGMAKFIPIN